MEHRQGLYEKALKRSLDILCALLSFLFFFWLYAILAILVKVKLGGKILYTAIRIGKNGKPFKLYKFRTMTEARDEQNQLLPDSLRLTRFGRVLRATSLDELPEAINILKGDMSVIGPRPLPVSYQPFFTEEERHRHDVRPGLSGWAQVNGRNSISWEEKFHLDLWYISHVSFRTDCRIVAKTVMKVLKRSDIGQGDQAPKNLYDERSSWIKTEKGAISPAGKKGV